MSSRYPILIRSIQIVALIVVLFGVFFPDLLLQIELIIAISLIVLIGIPHGATDYIIFQYLSKPFWGTDSLFYFYRNYILIMGAYALLWWLVPTFSLLVFILLSIYHFGQSNWNFLEKTPNVLKHLLFIIWGSFVLLTPILAHYEQAQPIIAQILGFDPIAVDEGWRYAIIAILFAHSVLFCLYLHRSRRRGVTRSAWPWRSTALTILSRSLTSRERSLQRTSPHGSCRAARRGT